ncbi:hypothetical protein MPDQ_006736 [Monascus purpureus]|uniref:SGNH hydrolase-type esterase domain-containing protein n=1 Tax=Monascus purpureus TaxID=5098 RepID=A0A507QVZ9_MONPU|nr:hypothetical protein MPDQ_006736 [Monascus purpureus]
MWTPRLAFTLLLWWPLYFHLHASATILDNGQPRRDPYPGQAQRIDLDESWRRYGADAPEIAYKGRWDSKHISWWSAPGLRLQFSGGKLAITFGPNTDEGTLVAYRIDSLDWQFSNVTADSTYQFVGPWSDLDEAHLAETKVFEMRVQIAGVAVAGDALLTVPPTFPKKVEIIGGSLASGQFATYETLSSWAHQYVAGLGNVEYTITAYPGACLVDNQCYGGVHGMTWYWHRASDPGFRAAQMYGPEPEEFDVGAGQPADLVLIQMGGNDHRPPNEIAAPDFYHAYIDMIEDVHRTWPHATVLIVVLSNDDQGQWGLFHREGTKYVQDMLYEEEHKRVHEYFKDRGFVYYFPTRGILQHNDIAPKDHPTDYGHAKVASHLLQWTRLVLGWQLEPTGEVQHGTLFWNDQQEY